MFKNFKRVQYVFNLKNRVFKMNYNYPGTFFRLCILGGLFIFLMLCSFKNPLVYQKDKEGFIKIFDGKSLKNWEGDSTYWRVENGAIVGEVTSATLLKRNSFLIWRGGCPDNFELKVEYRISGKGNSGINYRSEDVKGNPYALKGYQADIDGQNQYTGQNYEERGRCIVAFRGQKVMLPNVKEEVSSLVKNNVWTATIVTGVLGNIDSLKEHINDGWNEYHLIVKGNHLQHFINGVLMSDVTDDDKANRKFSGLLGVQVHVGPPMKVEYRNFRIRNLK